MYRTDSQIRYAWAMFMTWMLLVVSIGPVRAIEPVDGVYRIGTAEELAEYAKSIDLGDTGSHALLTADIDFRDYPTTILGSSSDHVFQGIFDGDGHVITLGINTTTTGNYSGAFIRFARNATIRNLRLEGSVSTCGKHCASLISFATGNCTITNVVSSVSLSSNSYDDCMGGFVGIAGENFTDKNTNITFNNCAFTGSITYTGEDVKSVSSIGRFAHHGGGFVGWKGISNSRVYLNNCYSAPRKIQQSANFYPFVRYWPYKDIGVVSVRNCYYASNISDYGKSQPMNVAQGHSLSQDEFENGQLCALLNVGCIAPAWQQRYGKDRYPLPTNIDPSTTKGGMKWITNADELEEFAQIVNTTNQYAHAILTTDIDYRKGNTSIGSIERPFMGIFDGDDHRILVSFVDNSPTALFGCVGHEGLIKNLHVDGKIQLTERTKNPLSPLAGIVANLKGGYVTGCLSTVNISQNGASDIVAGGIVGECSDMASISNCVYAGLLNTEKTKTVGCLVGQANSPSGSPSAIIRNSIAFQSSDTLSLRATWPLYGGIEQHIQAQEVFRLILEDFYPDSANGPDIQQLSNGDIFQIIWDRQIVKTKETIDKQEYNIKKSHLLLILGGMVSLLIIISLLAVIWYFKAQHLDLQRRFEETLRLHQQWEDALKQAREKRVPKNDGLGLLTDRPNIECRNAKQEDPAIEGKVDEVPNEDNIKFSALYDRLLRLMDEHHLFRLEGLDESTLAQELATNVKYLSQCIRQCSDQSNFSTWLATYRINHALSMIAENPQTDVMTICHESGFSNHSTFNRHFKKSVGMTAQQYIQMMRSKR